MSLAAAFVRMYHGQEAAEAARQHFVTVFQQRALPEDIELCDIPENELQGGAIRLVRLLTLIGFASSNSEARRSIQQGAVKLNEVKIEDPHAEIAVRDGDIIQAGRRKFAKLRLL